MVTRGEFGDFINSDDGDVSAVIRDAGSACDISTAQHDQQRDFSAGKHAISAEDPAADRRNRILQRSREILDRLDRQDTEYRNDPGREGVAKAAQEFEKDYHARNPKPKPEPAPPRHLVGSTVSQAPLSVLRWIEQLAMAIQKKTGELERGADGLAFRIGQLEARVREQEQEIAELKKRE